VFELFSDAPVQNPRAAAYLLAAHAAWFPAGTVFLSVVDPGVGGPRAAIALAADGRWFVGPDNGLFELVARRAGQTLACDIVWRPSVLSASFHGRDLFAPVAGWLAAGSLQSDALSASGLTRYLDWPDDLYEIIYVDHYGNAITGIRSGKLAADAVLAVGGRTAQRARAFSDVRAGEAFWYDNANALVEIAINQGNAARDLNLEIGTPVALRR
jgi:S-adenosylmethionine hydrolase